MSRPDGTMPGTFDDTPFRMEWTPDGHVTEESVYAWLDGALDDDEQHAVDGHVQSCAACAAAVADARGYIAASVRIMLSADLASDRAAHGSADDAPVLATAPQLPSATGRPTVSRAPRWFARSAVRIAAGVCVMVAGAGYLASREVRRPTPRADVVAGAPDVAVSAPTPAVVDADSAAGIGTPAAATPSNPAPRAVGVVSERPATESPRAPITRTITGRVLDGGVPVASASVLIAGTTVGTITDSMGRYTLRGVPDTVATLLARRIGYNASLLKLGDIASDSTPVNIQLTASVNSLSSVVVTSVQPSEAMLRARCLVAEWPTTADERPLLRMLRGTVRAASTQSLVIVGWPDPTAQTRGTFALDSVGSLTGSAASGDARLEFSLQSFDDRWEGTVTESRGETRRVEDVSFVPETSAERCSRIE